MRLPPRRRRAYGSFRSFRGEGEDAVPRTARRAPFEGRVVHGAVLRWPPGSGVVQRDLDRRGAVEDVDGYHDLARGEEAVRPVTISEAEPGHGVEVENPVNAVALLGALRREQRDRRRDRVRRGHADAL